MKNKTCNDCRYMLHKDTFEVCTLCMTETAMFDNACEHFTPPTVGDRIRALSDEELAEEFVDSIFDRVAGEYRYYSMLTAEFYNNRTEAITETVAELKKEVKDGQ